MQRGDTLYSIAMAFGVDVRELARWNGLPDASVLRVGQTLRVAPPADAAVATVTPVTPGGSTEVRPLPAPGGPVAATPLPPGAATPHRPRPNPRRLRNRTLPRRPFGAVAVADARAR